MPKPKRLKPMDVSQLARSIVERAIGSPLTPPNTSLQKTQVTPRHKKKTRAK